MYVLTGNCTWRSRGGGEGIGKWAKIVKYLHLKKLRCRSVSRLLLDPEKLIFHQSITCSKYNCFMDLSRWLLTVCGGTLKLNSIYKSTIHGGRGGVIHLSTPGEESSYPSPVDFKTELVTVCFITCIEIYTKPELRKSYWVAISAINCQLLSQPTIRIIYWIIVSKEIHCTLFTNKW